MTSPLHFELCQAPPAPLDVSPLIPASLRGRGLAEICRLPLTLGSRTVSVGEMFRISGSNPESIVFAGECDGLQRIGTGLESGSILVEGSCGDELGVAMRGGKIQVNGSAGNRAAASLCGGEIEIFGDVGDDLAAPRGGERSGMRGGSVYVAGQAGQGAGHRLRRGTVTIAGTVGAYCCAEMVAGTLVAAEGARDEAGWNTLGQGMRRGSLLLPRHPSLSPLRFTAGQLESLGVFHLLAHQLRPLLPEFADALQGRVRRCLGDLTRGGYGELILLS